MITTDVETTAHFDSRVKGLVYAVAMDFRTASVYFNTSSEDTTIGGNNYIGRGSLIEFPRLQESEDTSTAKLVINISLINQAMVAATIGDAGEYRMKKIRIYLQLLDEKFKPKGLPMLRWRGYMDKISVEKSRSDESIKGTLRLECVRPGLARARRYDGLRLTHQQHIKDHPTDRGLEYMQELVNTPVPWLTIDFQKQ